LARAPAGRVGDVAVAHARNWPRKARATAATAATAVVLMTATTGTTTVVASSTASRAPSVGLGGVAAVVLGARAASALRTDTSSTTAGLRRPLPDLVATALAIGARQASAVAAVATMHVPAATPTPGRQDVLTVSRQPQSSTAAAATAGIAAVGTALAPIRPSRRPRRELAPLAHQSVERRSAAREGQRGAHSTTRAAFFP